MTKRGNFRRNLLMTGAAVTAGAVVGGRASASGMSWYRTLRKPPWQPPRQTFALVWTPVYALIAYAGARALSSDGDRRGVASALAVNLALNAAWTPLFFRARSPWLAMLDVVALDVSNVVLLRRFLRADRRAGLALVPYVAWTAFATALNGSIAARNT
uniref:TspO/MBR family protein n=1 Tax=Nonomuraea pusilla TaxID=46177 RepID=UPI0009EB4B57|nr:TspO/MBR family protein [Nonomuraea pusilla]